MRKVLLALVVVVAAGCASMKSGGEDVRIDATSVETAVASYQAMMTGRSQAQQQQLALAVLMLNLEGVKSASDAGDDAGSVGPIKDKVAGLSADEIIALSARVKTLRIEVVQPAPSGR